MEPLPPIPSPPGHYWREFRVRVTPTFIFLGALCAVILIWRDHVNPPSLLGEVEVIRENVTSPKPGVLVQMNMSGFQTVKAGDPVAQVITTEPKVLAASLRVIQAEIDLLRANPVLDQQSYAVTYNRLRLEWLQERVDYFTAQVKLQQAERDLHRSEELFKEKIISEQLVEDARSAKDALKVEVEQRSQLLVEQDLRQAELRPALNSSETNTSSSATLDPLQAAISLQEEKLRLTEVELGPITLTIPMDGMISTVFRRSGETIMAGEPILTISSPTSGRIIGFLRQPLSFAPKVDMPVEVRSRSSRRGFSQSKILQVGTQMEPITASLLPVLNPRAVERGLPILLGLPADLDLFPGELVELTIRPLKR